MFQASGWKLYEPHSDPIDNIEVILCSVKPNLPKPYSGKIFRTDSLLNTSMDS